MVDRRQSAGGTDGEAVGARDECLGRLALAAEAGANTKLVDEEGSIRVPAVMIANNEESFLSLGEAAKVR